MSKLCMIPALLLATILVGAAAEPFRQRYPIEAATAAQNRAALSADRAAAPEAWRTANLAYYVVPPLSDIPRTPELHPADGAPFGTLEYIAAQGEYEPASFVVTPQKEVDRFMPRGEPLRSAGGDTIPATALDIKLIKVWYQAGSAWYGYFADALGRRLIPELLLNDEELIRVDPATQDNYVRYLNKDGSTHYQWMSANFMVVNYTMANQANQGLIRDADTLQPAVLNRDEYKQYFVTLHVPETTPPGLYRGRIVLEADGQIAGHIPVAVRVLPFALPRPGTNYNLEKEYFLSLYGTASRAPKVLKNLAAHNLLNPMGMPNLNVMNPAGFTNDLRLAREAGISTECNISGAPSVSATIDQENPKATEKARIAALEAEIAAAVALTREHAPEMTFYSYGVDEGGPETIRRERDAWRAAHAAGGRVMVSSYQWRELLFALDFIVIPGAPVPERAELVRLFHEANPDSLCGWYANPHSGPENPNYFRRIHGLLPYKMNYDVSANYCWWRNNWNDMATPYEPNLRNIVMVQATSDNVLDTLAWEGVREGLDDIRYATKLRLVAGEALQSADVDVRLAARRALAFIAYWDGERDDLDAFRSETIRYILQLQQLMMETKS